MLLLLAARPLRSSVQRGPQDSRSLSVRLLPEQLEQEPAPRVSVREPCRDVRCPWREDRSSAVGDQRHASCAPLPMIPSVRKSIHTAQARKIAATIVTRRREFEKRRVRTAHATKTGATTAGSA